MPRQELLTESQRLSLQSPASDERTMVRHYLLSSEDLALITLFQHHDFKTRVGPGVHPEPRRGPLEGPLLLPDSMGGP